MEGINNLYEFSCGDLSGWIYSVNGSFPSISCSEYKGVGRRRDSVAVHVRFGARRKRGMRFFVYNVFDSYHPVSALVYFCAVIVFPMVLCILYY